MAEFTVLQKVILGPTHEPTEATRHFRDGALIDKPYELRVIQYIGDLGVYLFYCDTSGEEMTDTYHDSMEAALRQAEREFNVHPDEWEIVVR